MTSGVGKQLYKMGGSDLVYLDCFFVCFLIAFLGADLVVLRPKWNKMKKK